MIMNAMILAAGRGERMRPLTDNCPKPLLKVKGKALIVYHLEALSRAGFCSVVINLSWLGKQIETYLGNGSTFDLDIVYSQEPEALETAGGIVKALPLLSDQFVVVNADIFTDFDFSSLSLAKIHSHLVLVPNPAFHANGDFSIEHGMLSNAGQQRFTFSGIAQYQKSFFSNLKQGKRTLAPMLQKAADRSQISAELFQGNWVDVGTLERLEALQ